MPLIFIRIHRDEHISFSLHQHLRSTITITISHNLLMSHYCSTKMTIKLTLYTHTPHNLFLLLRGMTHSRVFSFCIVAGGPHRCVCGVGTLYKCVYRYIVYSTTSLWNVLLKVVSSFSLVLITTGKIKKRWQVSERLRGREWGGNSPPLGSVTYR